MKHNGYSIVTKLLEEDIIPDLPVNPTDAALTVADKVIDTTDKTPSKTRGKWIASNTAKLIKHLINRKKESDSVEQNKLKGI